MQKATRTVSKLTEAGAGRHYLHDILWRESGPFSLPDRTVKRMLQCITNTYPTQSRLHQMSIVSSGTCKFCNTGKDETLFHWLQDCPHFSDARTRVHHDIWSEVFATIHSHLPATWVGFKEITVGQAFRNSHAVRDTVFAARQPDGVFYNDRDVKYVLVDFTRGYGYSSSDLKRHEETKRAGYTPMVTALRVAHMVEFYPLACTYNGAIAEDTWRQFMNRLEISDKAQETILKTAIRAVTIGLSTMADIRLGSLTASRARPSTSGSRE